MRKRTWPPAVATAAAIAVVAGGIAFALTRGLNPASQAGPQLPLTP